MNKEIPICISAANRIINRTNANNRWRVEELGKPRVRLTGKRLQKILYLCQLFWYIDHEESNMIPEDFVAWAKGPVIPEIYDHWMVYQDGDMYPRPYANYTLSEEEADLINRVVDNTIDISTETIIDYIQLTNEPWINVYKKYGTRRGVISKESIKQFIRKDEVQKELVDFILKRVTYEELVLTRELTTPKHTEENKKGEISYEQTEKIKRSKTKKRKNINNFIK